MKKIKVVSPSPAINQTTPPPEPARAGLKATVIQPELEVEIEACRKRISSLKALNKLTPIIDGMDLDALGALVKIIKGRAPQLFPE